jgi:hypothetical protein
MPTRSLEPDHEDLFVLRKKLRKFNQNPDAARRYIAFQSPRCEASFSPSQGCSFMSLSSAPGAPPGSRHVFLLANKRALRS